MKLGLGMLEGMVVLVLFLAKSCLLVVTGVMCLGVVADQCLELMMGVVSRKMCSRVGFMVLTVGSCMVPTWGEHDIVLGLLDISWTAGGGGEGERVMISILRVNGDRDRLRLLREGAREDTVISLCLAGELDTLRPVSG